MEYYVHYVPGRLRIQTPVLRDNPKKAEEFERFIKGLDGITTVEIHIVTGSATLHFDEKKINCEQIIGILEKHGYFLLAKAETSDEFMEKTAEKVLEVAEKVVIDATEGGVGGE